MEVRNMNDDPASTKVVALGRTGAGNGLRRTRILFGLSPTVVV